MSFFKGKWKLFTGADIVLILFFLAAAIVLALNLNSHPVSSRARFYYRNELIRTLDLARDTVFTVDTCAQIEVRKGKVRIVKSTCYQQYCVKQGWSDRNPIICVPNEILIDFEGKENDKILITE